MHSRSSSLVVKRETSGRRCYSHYSGEVTSVHYIFSSDTWRGYKRGRPIMFRDRHGYVPRTKYLFWSYKCDLRSGRAWIEVWGGKPGHESLDIIGVRQVVDRQRKT